MKITKIFVLFLLITVTLFSGCSKQKGYSIKICGFSDSIPEAKHAMEYKEWSNGAFFDSKIKKNIDIAIEGNIVKAEYVDSEKKFYDYYNTHRYKDPNGNYLEVTDDGKLCSYFFGGHTNTDKIYTEDECIDIACKFLNNIVSADDYIINSEFDTNRNLYMISFTKFADGFMCADRADFMVEPNGNIYSYSSAMLGEIPKNAVTGFDINIIETQVISKLDKEYSEAKKIYDSVSYDNIEYILTLNEENEYALVCSVDVSCKKILGDYETVLSERIQLLIQ